MNLTQPTLVNFERERRKNNYIPPLGSNSFYNIGGGTINLLTKPDGRFDLFTDSGIVTTGNGSYVLGRTDADPDNLYDSMTVISDTFVSVSSEMIVSNANVDVYGTLYLQSDSTLKLQSNANVMIDHDAVLVIQPGASIEITGNGRMIVYGTIRVPIDQADAVLSNSHIVIDTAAVIDVTGLDKLGERVYSLKDYENNLRKHIINVDTQGEQGTTIGKIGYSWTGGSPSTRSQLIKIETLSGSSVLGDLKLSILGMPVNVIPNLQVISDGHTHEDSELYITSNYNGSRYVKPELYLGVLIDNCARPATYVVDGSIIVDGESASITVDRGASIHISETGSIKLINGAIMRNTYNDSDVSLTIDGLLIIDNIDQISTFNKANIQFGEKGKVVILNPEPKEPQLMWSTPIGIHDSDLYRIFGDKLEHVEYHLSRNCGIKIDKYYELYGRDMTDWYNGVRLEKAVHEGWIVWHDGAFIELDSSIIPWVNTTDSLLGVYKIFKHIGIDDKERLQSVVDRLKYAGFGDITFRLVKDELVSTFTMRLGGIEIKTATYNPASDMFVVNTDAGNGDLFLLRKSVANDPNTIIENASKHIGINHTNTEFRL